MQAKRQWLLEVPAIRDGASAFAVSMWKRVGPAPVASAVGSCRKPANITGWRRLKRHSTKAEEKSKHHAAARLAAMRPANSRYTAYALAGSLATWAMKRPMRRAMLSSKLRALLHFFFLMEPRASPFLNPERLNQT